MTTEDVSKRRGIIYLAFGAPYLLMALVSVRSLRKRHPDLDVCIVTNVDTSTLRSVEWCQYKITWIHLPKDDTENRSVKTRILEFSPFETTVFLDVDTVILDELDGLFSILRNYDLCIRQNMNPMLPSHSHANYRVLGTELTVFDFPQWNSGMIAARRCDATLEFFDIWNTSFHELGCAQDQPALVSAIVNTKARFLGVDSRWNFTEKRGFNSDEPVHVFHYMSAIDANIAKQLIATEAYVGMDAGIEDFIKRENRKFQKRKWNRLQRLGADLGLKKVDFPELRDETIFVPLDWQPPTGQGGASEERGAP